MMCQVPIYLFVQSPSVHRAFRGGEYLMVTATKRRTRPCENFRRHQQKFADYISYRKRHIELQTIFHHLRSNELWIRSNQKQPFRGSQELAWRDWAIINIISRRPAAIQIFGMRTSNVVGVNRFFGFAHSSIYFPQDMKQRTPFLS